MGCSMSDDKEKIPDGLVTALLTGYVKTIEEQRETISELQASIKLLHKFYAGVIISIIIAFLIAIGYITYSFVEFLGDYNVENIKLGDIHNSKINTSTGQQADTMTNYFDKLGSSKK